ncbi:hypothetical protein [Aeromonas enteropelogenes]|uniref:hypothetical protein n=1 Tax=Aeromonas enteropelogenes TaxID=29489 RepID=UPI003BA2AC7E
MTDTTQNPSEAANRALKTLLSQVQAIAQMPDGSAKIAISGFETMLTANLTMVIEAANLHIDEFNAVVDDAITYRDERDQLKTMYQELESSSEKLIQARKQDERNAQKILETNAQITSQRDTYREQVKELNSIKSERDRLKKQVARNKESLDAKDKELSKARQDVAVLQSQMAKAADAVSQAKELMRVIVHMMLQEGSFVEKTLELKGAAHYYIYRIPCSVHETFKAFEGDDTSPSLEHKYFFRVETSYGLHYDTVPMDDGSVAVQKPKALPADVKKFLAAEYAKETLFHADEAVFQNTAMAEKMENCWSIISTLSTVERGMEQVVVKKALTGSHHQQRALAKQMRSFGVRG